MSENSLDKINRLIKIKKIKEAQVELSKLGPEFFQDPEYLYLRSKIFFINKLYYIALEFEQNDKIYNLIAKIYNILGNKELSKNISDSNLRSEAVNSLKDQFSGIYRKG